MSYRQCSLAFGTYVFAASGVFGLAARAQTAQEFTVVGRVMNTDDKRRTNELAVRSEGQTARALIRGPDRRAINVAILLDAGPSQTKVLASEKDIAVSVVRGLSNYHVKLTIGKVGYDGNLFPTTTNVSEAVRTIEDLQAEQGKRTDVPIYDLAGAAIRELGNGPGLRVLIFIGGGKDLGSKLSYKELRDLAEANYVACFVLLVADRSHRGPKSMLSHGWWMRELADDTAGIFLENEKVPKAIAKVSENISALRLITFEMNYSFSGRHKISVKPAAPLRIRLQKAVIVSDISRLPSRRPTQGGDA